MTSLPKYVSCLHYPPERLGLVAEVLPRDELLAWTWEFARDFNESLRSRCATRGLR